MDMRAMKRSASTSIFSLPFLTLFFSLLLVGCDAGNSSKAVSTTPVGERSGQEIYQTYCFACHDRGVIGAPKFGSEASLARLQNKPIAEVLRNTERGIRAMPRKGTCLDCTPEELEKAVNYLLQSGSAPANQPQ